MDKLYPKKVWQLLDESGSEKLESILLRNREIKNAREFFDPISPEKLKLKDLKISGVQMKKAVKRIKIAKKNKEHVIIYGDYDADGVSATAIIWEALYKMKVNVMPYIPDRFKEGYGINAKSVEILKSQKPKLGLIITVDNGIVAHDAIGEAKKLGIDVIVSDHHEKDKKRNNAFAVIHTTEICGSGVAWILARELEFETGLELAAIGTVADQMPLIGANRSFVKHGISVLQKTKRAGLIELFEDARIDRKKVGTYEINYIIAPRINAMGRLLHGIEALRLVCTNDRKRAGELARLVSQTNLKRQKIVDEVVLDMQKTAKKNSEQIIFVESEKCHEGVVGLAAARLVEEFYRPSVVVSKGKSLSKGSARSIAGFNIIEAIQENGELLVYFGGHAMAAGFTIENSKMSDFRKRLNKTAKERLTKEILQRKLKIDCGVNFSQIGWELLREIKKFEPFGNGNPVPTFVSFDVEIVDVKFLGKEKKHLKLKLEQDKKYFDAIGFGMAGNFSDLVRGQKIGIVYNVEENEWNGVKSLQLKIKDLKVK